MAIGNLFVHRRKAVERLIAGETLFYRCPNSVGKVRLSQERAEFKPMAFAARCRRQKQTSQRPLDCTTTATKGRISGHHGDVTATMFAPGFVADRGRYAPWTATLRAPLSAPGFVASSYLLSRPIDTKTPVRPPEPKGRCQAESVRILRTGAGGGCRGNAKGTLRVASVAHLRRVLRLPCGGRRFAGPHPSFPSGFGEDSRLRGRHEKPASRGDPFLGAIHRPALPGTPGMGWPDSVHRIEEGRAPAERVLGKRRTGCLAERARSSHSPRQSAY